MEEEISNQYKTQITISLVLLYIVMLRRLNKNLFPGLFSLSIKQIQHIKKIPILHSIFKMMKSDNKTPPGLPDVEKIEIVSNKCTRILGLNPSSHTLQGTNTYLIGTGENKILIDTGENDSAEKYVKLLFDEVFPKTNTKNITTILLSHGHYDHQGGVNLILKEISKRGLKLPKVYKRIILNGDFPANDGFECLPIQDGQVFKTGKCSIKSVFTPGHCDDHVAFLFKEDLALVSGDCILGCGTTVFDDLTSYMNTLHNLKEILLKENITSIYPGHGPVIRDSAIEKIDEYILHRNNREKAILDILLEKYKNRFISSWDLVHLVYGRIPFTVKISAQYNLTNHLKKLEKEKKVFSKFPDLWRC
jgi:glyoxylase-like metal-dependent hydrolase (beta-lactamase superfamily II)